MKRILVIGIGTGNPDHLTLQAVKAMNRADVIFVPTKGAKKADLADLRREIISGTVTNPATRTVEFALPERVIRDRGYVGAVDDWHAAIAEAYRSLFDTHLAQGGTGAFLVWGDPMLYDSTLRILDRVQRADVAFDIEVIAGITSIQALCAAHRIPLNLVGKPVEITTGRRLHESFPHRSEASVVMLDGEQAFASVEDEDAMIYWGAYLGADNEIAIAGRLGDVREEILARRAEARAQNGWIMDIYLLRKGEDFDDLDG